MISDNVQLRHLQHQRKKALLPGKNLFFLEITPLVSPITCQGHYLFTVVWSSLCSWRSHHVETTLHHLARSAYSRVVARSLKPAPTKRKISVGLMLGHRRST